MSKLILAIETQISRGQGIEGDPCRTVVQYFDPDGELLAERDTWTPPEKPDLSKKLAVAESNCKYWDGCFTAEAKAHQETQAKVAALTEELQKLSKLNQELMIASASRKKASPKSTPQASPKGRRGA